jgi:hypothetical protein
MRLKRFIIQIGVALTTPLLEKNPAKSTGLARRKTPFVFSMSRLIVLAFAGVMLRQGWMAGILGWPEATLSIAIVLALPILGALERVLPSETIGLAKALVQRFGIGTIRQTRDPFANEPSKFDDHRNDHGDDAPVARAAPSRRKAA